MIIKTFYDEKDYEVVLNLLNKYKDTNKDVERVFTRQLFMRGIETKAKGDINEKHI